MDGGASPQAPSSPGSDLASKYTKLASEYSKLRAQSGVLKKAVIEEQVRMDESVSQVSFHNIQSLLFSFSQKMWSLQMGYVNVTRSCENSSLKWNRFNSETSSYQKEWRYCK